MRALRSLVALAVLAGSCCVAAELPRSSPEAQGVASAAVLAFVEAADKEIDSLHSFLLVRRGQVLAEGWWAPYDAQSPHALFSLSKSFTSTAVGLAIAEGKLALDDRVIQFFPDDLPPEPSEHLRAMRVHDLLTMSTGHETEPRVGSETPWTKTFLAHPVPHAPGSRFLYNTPATYMLSAIVQKVTGQTVLDYLQPRLFEPLGIERPIWLASPQGITIGGYGLSVRTEDIARFGQLYLQEGRWQGKSLLPAEWVATATAKQVANDQAPSGLTPDWQQGYGFQFWRCQRGAVRGDGAFGQYCIVMPEQDAVIAITAGVKDMQAVLNLVWEKLLPAMHSESLPPDEQSLARLTRTLRALSLHAPAGSAAPADKLGQEYVFAANEQKLEAIALEGDADGTTLVARFDGRQQSIRCARGAWHKGRAAWGASPEQPIAASGAWDDDGAFTARLCFYETPFVVTVRLAFAGDEVRCNAAANVGFGPTQRPELVGKARANR